MNAPIAFIACGSNDPARVPAGNHLGDYVSWARDAAPRLQRHGLTRVFLHNPGGQHFVPYPGGDSRPMRVDQWQLAERRRYAFADRYDFRTAVGILESHGVTEVIIYLGSPTQLLDPVSELPEIVEPFAACGPIITFSFDATFEDGVAFSGAPEPWQDLWAPGSEYRKALANLRRSHKVYAEARVHPPQLAAGLGKLVDGTVADVRVDDYTRYDLAKQPGETIRLTHPLTEAQWRAAPWWPEVKSWPANVTPLYRSDFNWGPLLDAYEPPAGWRGGT